MNEATFPEEVTEQHSSLRMEIRGVRAAHDAGSSWNELAALLDTLVADVRHHFSTEEGLMLRAAYPRFQEHQDLHVAFVQRLTALREQCEHQRSELIGVLVQLLETWFKNHEETADRDAMAYLASRTG